MSESLYIYAFMGEACVCEAAGIKDAPVRCVGTGDVFALVSEAPSGKIRPQRSMLVGHQRVLSSIATQTTTLPASFGLVAESERSVLEMLRVEGDSIREELERVGGCVEMSVELSLDVPNVFEYLVSIDDELRDRRDRLVSLGDRASHDDRVATGRRVERVINALRAEYGEQVLSGISDVCREISVSDVSGDDELFSAACLVERSRVGELEEAVHNLAETMDDMLAFTFSGPFAPHNFVHLRLDAVAA